MKEQDEVDPTWSPPSQSRAPAMQGAGKREADEHQANEQRWATEQLQRSRAQYGRRDADIAKIEAAGLESEIYYSGLRGVFPKLWVDGYLVKASFWNGKYRFEDASGLQVEFKQRGLLGYRKLRHEGAVVYSPGSPSVVTVLLMIMTGIVVYLALGGIVGAVAAWFAMLGIVAFVKANSQRLVVAYGVGAVIAIGVLWLGVYSFGIWLERVS